MAIPANILTTMKPAADQKIDGVQTFSVLLRKCQELVQQSFPADVQLNIRKDQRIQAEVIELLTAEIQAAHEAYLAEPEQAFTWPEGTPEELAERIFRMLYGLGPIEALLERPDVEDIAVNGPGEVQIRTAQGWTKLPEAAVQDLMVSTEQLTFMFNQAIARSGQQAGPLNPIVDDQLPNGHRLSLVVNPVTAGGASPIAVIRRHRPVTFSIQDFLQNPVQVFAPPPPVIPDYLPGWTPDALLTPAAAHFLHQMVLCGANILLIGRTGVGKTAFLSMLGRFIPHDRRVLVLEDTRELNLRPGRAPENVVYLTTALKKLEGGVEVKMSRLIKTALRQRPDHLILGEARGEEVWDLLNAMQTGHGGNLTSIHAISARDLIERVRFMVSLAGVNLDAAATARILGSSFHLVITLLMDWTGRRYISEIAGLTGEVLGDQPEIEYLFAGGEERDYRLQLLTEATYLEPLLQRNQMSFQDVIALAQRERALLNGAGLGGGSV